MSAKLLFRVDVDLGNGRSNYMTIREGDSAIDVAEKFCAAHRLPVEVSELLALEIQKEWQLYISCMENDEIETKQLMSPILTSPLINKIQSSSASSSEEIQDTLQDLGLTSSSSGQSDSPRSSRSSFRHSSPRSSARSSSPKVDRSTEAKKREYYAALQQKYNSANSKKVVKETKLDRRAKKTLSHNETETVVNRLYGTSLKRKEKQEKAQEEAKESRVQEELRECTFKPKITSFAKKEAGGRTHGIGLDMQVRKYQETKLIREFLQKEQEKLLLEQECSFQPKISKKSVNLANHARQRHNDLHEDLFLEAEKRRVNKALIELTPQYSFQPETGNDKKAQTGEVETEEEFLSRMSAPRTPHPLSEVDVLEYDPFTGEQLFKPHISRGPTDERARPKDMSISDYLFYSRHQFEGLRERLRREEDELWEDIRRKGCISNASREMASSIQQARYMMVWKALNEEVVKQDETDELKLRCLVDLLPEILLRYVGPDAILQAAEKSKPDFVSFMLESSRGVPCTSDLLAS